MQIEPLIFSRLLGLDRASHADAFQRRLPGVLERAYCQWGLELERWAEHSDYSAVAFCRQGVTRCVLKVPLDPQLVAVESFAFNHWDGEGAVRLLARDEDALLLEAADPGTPLAALAEPERAAHAAEALRGLHARPAPAEAVSLTDHLAGHHQEFAHLVGQGATKAQLALLEELVERLTAAPAPSLLHGDPHSRNLLLSARGCLAIDPLPMAGDGGYDLAYWALIDCQANRGQGVAGRLDRVAMAYGYPRFRLEAWAYVVACGKAVNAHWGGLAERLAPMTAYLDEAERRTRLALEAIESLAARPPVD